ncbi:MAG: amino acid adenylation domain-containing protein [Verrucomicrobiales bacterium]|nr:amino acid adenylation domain-containing protein [Verrucomicrobiales bacterium]
MAPPEPTLLSDLRVVLGELAGQDLASANSSSTFFELGFDSLLLTQASSALKARFGVKVTFRQLLVDLTTLDALAHYIAAQRPASAPVSKPPPPPAVSAPAPMPVPMVHRTTVPEPTPVTAVESMPSVISSARQGGTSGESRLTGTALERVINAQLRVMQDQLAMLRMSTPSPAQFAISAPTSATVEATSVAPAAVSQAGAASVPAPAVAGPAPAAAPALAPQHGPFKPIDKGRAAGISDQQAAAIRALSERYVARYPRSKEYTQRYRDCLADPRAVAGFKVDWKEMVFPIVTTRSSGSKLWDLDDHRWVDVTMGFGVALLGHSPGFVTEAVKRQLELGVEIGPQSPIVGEVARMICEMTGMERVTFCNTGSEAVMAALRICRTVTGRSRVALFAGAYHGTFDEVLVKGAMRDGAPRTLAIAPGIPPNLIAEVTVLEYGAPASLEWIRKNAEELAAVLVEPVQSRHPGLQPREFLHEVRRITQAAETPLIFDEVITGFRCHPGGAQAHFGIRADLATYGKIIGGGMPLGFIAGRKEYMDAFDGGQWQYGDDSFPPTGVTFFAGTFVRHPLAMAAGRAMLQHLKEHGPALQSGLAERTAAFTGHLNSYFRRHSIPVELEHFTSVWYPKFGPDSKFSSLLYFFIREKGVHIWEGRPCFLSTSHDADDLETITRAFKWAIAEMQAGDLMPGTSDPEFVQLAASGGGLSTAQAAAVTGAASGAGALVGDASAPFPLTEAQRELWFASQLGASASAAFNESCSITFRGPLNVNAMESAVRLLVARHEALRTVFLDGGEQQQCLPTLGGGLEVLDLSALAAEARTVRLRELQVAEASRGFDLARGPLVVFRLVRLEPEHHVLLFTAHHVACDGWSYDIILRELGEAYTALAQGGTPTWEPATAYREYSAWEREQSELPEGRSALAYWQSQFTTLPPLLELPVDRPRGSRRSFQGAQISRELSAELVTRLRRCCASRGSTLFTLLLSAYATLLRRLSGQTDVVIGIPAAGQNLIGKEDLVGHCANLLPLRFNEPGDPTAVEWMNRVKRAMLDAFEHQQITLGSLLQTLRVPRQGGQVPLVSAIFNLDPPLSDLHYAGLAHEIELNPRAHYQFDLGFNVVDEKSTLLVECHFNTDLFEASTVARWLEHFEALLESFDAQAQAPLSRLGMLSGAQRQEMLVDWNRGRADGEQDGLPLAHRRIEAQARATPSAIAVKFGQQSLTYQVLNERANHLAHRLRGMGVGPDVLVAVCLERSLEMLVSVLGVLKAGGGYLPIDPGLPTERIAFMMADSGAPVLITQSSLIGGLPSGRATALCIDDGPSTNGADTQQAPVVDVQLQHLAYVIYTSGSTGKPKGVEVLHRGLANFVATMLEAPGVMATDNVAANTTLSFDIAAFEILVPLAVGAQVTILPRAVSMDPVALASVLKRDQVTVLQATPVTWRMLLDSGWTGEPGLRAITGGEALTRDLADRLIPKVRELWNGYGPTETTVYSTVVKVASTGRVTIGRPVAATQVYVVDDAGQPVPVGVPGELWIGGAGLARGYRHRPDLTAERFVPNEILPGAPSPLYRTGDLVRYLPYGEIEYIGRRDFQVKLRGYRIELGEIEAAIARYPQVRKNVVVARESGAGEKELVAYVVPETGRSVELWMASPVVDGHHNYDDTLYEFMTRDQARNGRFKAAFQRRLPGRTLLDLGTGKDAILARLAVEAGARKVYAVEILEEPYRQAKALVESLGLSDRIEVLLGDALRMNLPEPVDACVAEVIGHIGGEAGLETLLGEAARRHLKPGGLVFPQRVETRIAAVCLPGAFRENPRFGRLAGEYVRRAFETVGRPHDVRLSISGLGAANLRSDSAVFERCALGNGAGTDYESTIRLTVNADGPIDGFLLWLNLQVSEEDALDGLTNQASWLPVLVPAFHPAIEAKAGEVIEVVASGRLAANRFCKDYGVRGRWIRRSGEEVKVEVPLPHVPGTYRGSPFYQHLFRDNEIPVVQGEVPRFSAAGLKSALRSQLPDYMVPSAVVVLDELPTSANGKVDRKALPAPTEPEVWKAAPATPEPVATVRGTPGSALTAEKAPARVASDTEKRLIELWRQFLRVSEVGAESRFFELGGHSLLAVRLFGQIEKEFGVRLPLSVLLEDDGLENLAKQIDERRPRPQFISLVKVQPNGTRPPFFCVHGGGGEVLFGRDLARHLAPEIPFYALQARGVVDPGTVDETVEQMAEHYLPEIRAAQPRGPYHLGGFCMGGLVAYEMAQRLMAAGEKVGCLALIDTYNLVDIPEEASYLGRARMTCEKLRFQLTNVARLPSKERGSYLRWRFGETLNRRSRRMRDRIALYWGKLSGRSVEGHSRLALEEINDRAGMRYRPRPYPGDGILFRPEKNYAGYSDPLMAWGGYFSGELKVVVIPVNPGGMLVEPYIGMMGVKLREALLALPTAARA